MNRPAKFVLALSAAALPMLSFASSHREAPFLAGLPRIDGTDFYMFDSYEPGRSGYVTLIANYIPFENPAGGPNFYPLDPHAIYAINIDNSGSGYAAMSFQFRFTTMNKNFAVQAGNQSVAIPLINDGPVDTSGKALNVQQSYKLTVYRRGNGGFDGSPATNMTTGGATFYKPADNIGNKSIPDYASYANNFIYDVMIPGCPEPGRVFVGQRKDGFVANLGDLFDLVNTNPVGPRDAEPNTLSGFNVTSIALEVPARCLTNGKDPVIGAWTTSYLPHRLTVPTQWDSQGQPVNSHHSDDQDDGVEVSRLGMPLVNEVVIGLPDKDRWNHSMPAGDAQFLKYVTNPSLPVLLNTLFGNAAMVPATPRNDLVAVFLTGIKGINQPANVHPAEMLRLNTSIAPTLAASQNDLGVLGGDKAGFPNGRRPVDDVVTITLRAAEGALCGVAGSCGSETSDPNHGAPYTDGTRAAGPDAASEVVTGAVNPLDTYLDAFPYLYTPRPGSPNGPNGIATTPPSSTTMPY
ncbi:MAG: DUF4331 domain-containing protein [Gammaproteobacteria bacterium]|nr:DUF4331 domain-containing protein [Gammaproteobacteria bacterium]